VSGISTWAGRQVLHALTDETLTGLGESAGPARVLREAFTIAVRRCFADGDPREITGYVRELLARRSVPCDGAAAREAEALMRAALGRPAAADDIADDRTLALMILVISDLARATVADASPGVERACSGAGAGSASVDAEGQAGPSADRSADPASVLLAALVDQAEHRIARLDPAGRR
jgi:hypothetical protein